MDRRLGRPLPYQLPNPTQAHPCPLMLSTLTDAGQCPYAVLATVSGSYSPDKGRLPTRYAPVRH